MNTQSITGRCFCENIRFEVAGPEKFACFCYCESCQRAAGAPVVAWATYARDTFVVRQGTMHWHSSSPGVTRGICNNCGSSITYENEKRPGEIDISVNCLDDPGAPTPRAHIWTEDKQPWLLIGDDLPVYKQTVA
ncbi:MAG: GFA family protein [Gammaproteobacteria bacterium]|nr:GFA family protein [Gammaproteobacteria bacterium]